MERMHHIAKYFPEQHLQRIDKVELIEKLCWVQYEREEDPSKKVKILDTIMSLQPYISGYYDATRFVLEKTVKSDADLYKEGNLRPYFSIDVKNSRREEIEQEIRAKRRDNLYEHIDSLASQEESNSETVTFASIQDMKEVIASSDDVNDTPIEEQRQEEQQQSIGRPWTRQEAERAVKKAFPKPDMKNIDIDLD